jgi:hypothetical protein
MSAQTDTMPDSRRVALDGPDRSSPAAPPAAEPAGLDGLAEQLVAQARERGVALTGPGGLLSGFTARVLQTALETELTEHLGHEHGEPSGADGNIRNGHSTKTVRTEIGDVQIKVPRDRRGSFEPVLVPKHARRLTGFDEQVISLYAKGMTTGDIVNHLAGMYGSQVSKDLVFRVTDAVVVDMAEWAARPLDSGRIPLMVANQQCACRRAHRCMASVGVRSLRQTRGRSLSSAATISRCSLRHTDKSVPRGKYCRSRPLTFSLLPLCQGE